MLCVLPVHEGDVFLLLNLLRWIKELGGCPCHAALIVADAALPWNHAQTAITLASDSFDSVQFITNGEPVDGWIPGSNSLWTSAAAYCSKQEIDGWLWLEPDAVPLRAGWLNALEKAWEGTVSDFLACRYSCDQSQTGVPREMMTGVAIYPSNALAFFRPVAEAFDVQLSRNALGYVEHTRLIQQVWGELGLAPTFRESAASAPRHGYTLDKLDPQAVLFHRNKDGSLIELLRARAKLPAPPALLVVLPVCNKDAALMVKCLEWCIDLDGRNPFDCVLSYDPTLAPHLLNQLKDVAGRAFRSVTEFIYPRPPREVAPDACNVTFQSTAHYIQAHLHRSWLWFEADCVPIKPNWLPTLWLEYRNCGFPVMGPVIPGMGHMNGTGIYPANFANLSPRAMCACNGQSWDTEMTPDLVGRTHDCMRTFCHRWGMVDGNLHPSAGVAPHFASALAVQQWVPPDAVLFHRCKDGSLITQLRAMKK